MTDREIDSDGNLLETSSKTQTFKEDHIKKAIAFHTERLFLWQERLKFLNDNKNK